MQVIDDQSINYRLPKASNVNNMPHEPEPEAFALDNFPLNQLTSLYFYSLISAFLQKSSARYTGTKQQIS